MFDVALLPDRSTYRHVPHRPGQLKVELFEDDAWKPRLTIPVELILEKIPVEFSAAPNTLVASNQPQRSNAIVVAPLNKEDRESTRMVDVVLEAAAVPEERPTDSEEPWFPAKFPPAQLWLQPAEDDKPALADSRRPRLTLPLGKAFRVWLLPVDQPPEGQYRYELRTVGTEIGTTRTLGNLDVGKPQVEAVATELFGEPDSPVDGRLSLKLRDLLGAKRDVVLRSAFREPDKIEFKHPQRPAVLVSFVGPTIDDPVTLTTPREVNAPIASKDANFQLVLPADMEVGTYVGEVQVAGPGLSTTTVALTLLVDRLVLDLPSLDVKKLGWVPWTLKANVGDENNEFSPSQFVQFEERPGIRKVRVRRETNLPLDVAHLHAEFKGELTSPGDVQPDAPRVIGEPLQDEDSVVLTVEFPGVRHFNAERHPYAISFVVQPQLEAVQSAKCPAFRPIERRFEIRYVRLQDLLSGN